MASPNTTPAKFEFFCQLQRGDGSRPPGPLSPVTTLCGVAFNEYEAHITHKHKVYSNYPLVMCGARKADPSSISCCTDYGTHGDLKTK